MVVTEIESMTIKSMLEKTNTVGSYRLRSKWRQIAS